MLFSETNDECHLHSMVSCPGSSAIPPVSHGKPTSGSPNVYECKALSD